MLVFSTTEFLSCLIVFTQLKIAISKIIVIDFLSRFLRVGFSRAMAHVQPDVVIYLGDLFDEGSTGSESDFESYIARFQKVFAVPSHVKVVDDLWIFESLIVR